MVSRYGKITSPVSFPVSFKVTGVILVTDRRNKFYAIELNSYIIENISELQ
jgi:hypothetical protein